MPGTFRGDITQEEFFLAHRYVPRKGQTKVHPNPIKFWSCQGRMLVDVDIVPSEEEDDDWISFHFGDPDPAVSRFVNPKADQLSKENGLRKKLS